MRFEFVKSHSERYPVLEMCESLEVSQSGYYAWLGRAQSKRCEEDVELKDRISQLHERSRHRYGYRPIYHHLQEEAFDCGRDRTLRLMREMGIEGLQKKGFKPLGTDSKHDFGYSPNLLKDLDGPGFCDQVWVADTTYLRTAQGWCYLATVMDLYSRRILGWSVSDHNDSALCCQALRSAVLLRGGSIPEGLIHHSDRGSTYASYDYEVMLSSLGMRQSMSAKGNCYDNAAMESFFGRFKITTAGDITFADIDHARSSVFEYIEAFYNRFRKHSALGYKNPVEFEEKIAPPMGGSPASLPACIHNN